jgi:fructuronate reductase
MLSKVQEMISSLEFGKDLDPAKTAEVLHPILTDEVIFAIDLEKAGIADKVVKYFVMEMSAPGAVRKTLHEAL